MSVLSMELTSAKVSSDIKVGHRQPASLGPETACQRSDMDVEVRYLRISNPPLRPPVAYGKCCNL